MGQLTAYVSNDDWQKPPPAKFTFKLPDNTFDSCKVKLVAVVEKAGALPPEIHSYVEPEIGDPTLILIPHTPTVAVGTN